MCHFKRRCLQFNKIFSEYSRKVEKRMLKKAPIGSSVSLLPNSSDMASYSRRGQRPGNQKTGDINLTDSEWSSKVYLQGVKTAVESSVVSSSGMMGYSALGEDRSDNSLCFQDFGFSSFNSSTFHDKRLKASFDESTTKGILLEKLREVHMTMQGQAERLIESERELCLLRGQLESLSAEHEGLQREMHHLTVEKKAFEFFKSESLKNREKFLMRVNDLEKALTVLSTAHNALQTEAREKEDVLDKTSNYVTVLERDNNKLQEEYKKIHKDHAAVKHQLFKRMKATEDAKGKIHQLNEEIAQLKMERDVVNGKVIVLEEEVQHHKRSFSNLIKEHECLLKDKLEQDQRLQKEISERLCLKMVNDLLVEESAHVKEAFQKLEQLTCALEQKSEDFSQNLHKLEKVSENTDKEVLKESGPSTITANQQRGSVNFLQDEVHKIKETLARLESEKTELLSQVSNLQNEQNVWLLQRSELEMTQAELVAENTQLRRDLTSKFTVQAPENNTEEINQKFEEEKEEAVKKAKEIMKKSFDEVCLELKTLKSEFSKVWGKLERKGKEVEEHCRDLQQEQEQSQKLSEELMQLRKDYADLVAKTSSRSQVICTLRDELMQKCQEVIELEATISSERQQNFTSKAGSPLKRRTLENDKSFEQTFESAEISQTEFNEMKKLTSVNTSVNERLKELMIERDLALQDSRDLLNGMQQLRDAFEEEMERQLERERTDLRKEKHLLQMAKSQKDDDHPSNSDSSTETRLTLLTEQKIALEMKSKHLEYERDELRNQVEELCKMRTAAYEKAVQVDPPLSPRRRENKTTLRKRSKSVGMMSAPSTTTLDTPRSPDFMLVLAAIVGGIICAIIAIFMCIFACRYRTAHKVSDSSNSRMESAESEPILAADQSSFNLSSTEMSSNENVSPCPSCRKLSSFSNPCECDFTSVQLAERKPCQVQFSLFYNFHNSRLFINIMCALNVTRRWYGKYPPTQVRFQLLPDDSNIYRTEIKSNTAEPIFNETFEFIGYSENELRELILRLGLYAFDKFSRGKMIGYTDVHFNKEKLLPSEPTIIWRELLPKCQSRGRSLSQIRGEIHISLRYEAGRARLNVTVLKATNLLRSSKFLNTAPYVCLILNANGQLLESRKTKKSRGMNAVWNQGFLFDVKNETIDDYSVTIKVMNRDLLKNDELIGQVIIGSHSKGSGREHWEEAMRNKHNRREVAMTHILE